MKTIAVTALVLAGLSIFIPFGGYLAMLWSVMALISFRSEPVLSGVTFGLDMINTLPVVSPALLPIFPFVLAFHIVLLILAIVWRAVNGAPAPDTERDEPTVP